MDRDTNTDKAHTCIQGHRRGGTLPSSSPPAHSVQHAEKCFLYVCTVAVHEFSLIFFHILFLPFLNFCFDFIRIFKKSKSWFWNFIHLWLVHISQLTHTLKHTKTLTNTINIPARTDTHNHEHTHTNTNSQTHTHTCTHKQTQTHTRKHKHKTL